MNKKLVAGIVLGVGLLIGVSVVVVAELKHRSNSVVETGVEETENELVMPTSQDDDFEMVGENQEAVTIEDVTYVSNLNDYIDVEKFADAISQYGEVTVTSYGGGLGGEFKVELTTKDGQITGTWYDTKGEWIEE